MERILISETPKHIGEIIKIAGWVNVRRDHGKIIFIDIRDRSGIIQTVVIPDGVEAYETAKTFKGEYSVEAEGLIKERPVSAKKEGSATGGVEMEVKNVKISGKTYDELPIDISKEELDLNLDTLLNHRVLTLRNDKIKSIFKISSEVIKSYSEFLRKDDFLEIKTPKILNAATEGGANFFKIKYFEREAFLAQSPQFYKQIAAGSFERVFEVGTVFRAEPHFTSRHVNEFTGLDAEMSFINSFEDVMRELEKTMAYVMKSVAKNCSEDLKKYGIEAPKIKNVFPRIKLTEALDILKKEYGKEMNGVDIDPEGERLICEWVKKKYKSDFVFLTHYPTSLRPFYTMPSPDPHFTESYDLLFRGIEIASGGQRIHDWEQLVKNIQKFGLNPKDFKDYTDNFKYGMPPHGGWGLGLERIVEKILGLSSIKEAILFPRDVKRLTP
ncbi:MAG: aspartate--tRNA(Asn) ligase [Parcubacteria group bacterium]|jgi:nondiscriminating aspartyl-tRNA synthetase